MFDSFMLLHVPVVYFLYCCIVFHYMKRLQFTYPFSLSFFFFLFLPLLFNILLEVLVTASSVIPLSSCLQSFPASGSFPVSQFFASGGQSIGASASASVLPMNQSRLQDGLVGSPCSPRDSQESSSTQQFKSINCSALSFLYSPTLTSIHDHWKNHSLDQTDLC